MNIKAFVIGVIVIIALTLGVLFVWNLSQKDALEKYRTDFKAYQDTTVVPILELSKQLKNTSDSLLIIANVASVTAEKQTQQINKLSATTSKLQASNRKLLEELNNTDKPLPPECESCRKLANSLKDEADSLTKEVTLLNNRDITRVTEITSLRSSLTFQTTRSDSLQKVIINWPPPPPPPKVLGLRLSPRNTFLVGVVLGGVAVGSMK